MISASSSRSQVSVSSVSNRLALISAPSASRLVARLSRSRRKKPRRSAGSLARRRAARVAGGDLAVAEVEQLCPGRRHGRAGAYAASAVRARSASAPSSCRLAARSRGRRREITFVAPSCMRDAVEDVGGVHRPLLVGDDHELGAVGEAADELQEAVDVGVVERRLDLVEDVEGRGPGEEDAEDEGERDQRLLAAGEQREPPRRLAGRRHLDLDPARVVGRPRDRPPRPPRARLRLGVLRRRGAAGALDRPPASAPPSTRSGRCASTSRSRPRPPGNMCSISSSKFSRGGGERLLEGGGDLAVGLADQLRELGERLLEVLALRLELLDVRASRSSYSRSASGLTGPSCSRRRISRSIEASTAARSSSSRRVRLRRRIELEPGDDPLPLRLGLLAAVAQAGRPGPRPR